METTIPEWLKAHVLGMHEFEYNGERHVYAVVSSQLGTSQGAPAIFTILNDGVLAISDTYPEDERELGLIHEIVESKEDPNWLFSCQKALGIELKLAHERGFEMGAYISLRLDFFAGLIHYYEDKKRDQKENILLEKIKNGHAHLKVLKPVHKEVFPPKWRSHLERRFDSK